MYTENLAINLLLFVVGLFVLVKGSGWFVDAVAFIARKLNIPDVVVGLTIVSIGTSLPELAANVVGALQGKPEISMGVIPGSNVANILLVLGFSVVCMKQVPVKKIMFNEDSMVMMGSFVLFAGMCYFFPITVIRKVSGVDTQVVVHGLSRIESGILLLLFFLYMVVLLKRKNTDEGPDPEEETTFIKNVPLAILFTLIGGVLVWLGAQLMVDNVVWIATEKLKIPTPVVAATVVAFGTSVPELAVTITGIMKKKSDIALGNIVGSSIFNLIFVMGVTGMVAEVPAEGEVLVVILPFMLGSGLMLVAFMRSSWALVRWEGVVMLLGYASYIGVSLARVL